MAVKKSTEIIEIRPVEMGSVIVHIKGTSPLITHNWSEKAKKEMLDKQMKKAKAGSREAKNPVAEFATALYWADGEPKVDYKDWTEEKFIELATGAKFGFPVTAVKQCGISAAYRAGMVKDKMGLRSSFFIDGYGPMQLVFIESENLPEMREDMVKIGMGTADLRYRPMFVNWGMTLKVRYNKNGAFSLDQILNVINLGGQTNGIGEWRNERDGQFGMFAIDRVDEIEV